MSVIKGRANTILVETATSLALQRNRPSTTMGSERIGITKKSFG
ncbi:hypothetical protein N185_32420 [Sinorhizobium sp. GW3]|nr:hypothetical protein N185_32420 [Sinorhizobium sp. GW3]